MTPQPKDVVRQNRPGRTDRQRKRIICNEERYEETPYEEREGRKRAVKHDTGHSPPIGLIETEKGTVQQTRKKISVKSARAEETSSVGTNLNTLASIEDRTGGEEQTTRLRI